MLNTDRHNKFCLTSFTSSKNNPFTPILMKTKIFALSAVILAALVFSFCHKDKGFTTYTINRPIYEVGQDVKAAAKMQEPAALKDIGPFVLYNQHMYINEKNKGIHIVDYSNPSAPVNKGFIPLPGNKGIAIRNNVLYADCYSDLFMLQISGDGSAHYVGTLSGAFPSRIDEGEACGVVTMTWVRKDTTVYTADFNSQQANGTGQASSTAKSISNSAPSGNTSVGSSMAIFTIVDDHLYTVDNAGLQSFSLADGLNPVLQSTKQVGSNIETIFPCNDRLFIGSSNGMFIYDISNPSSPGYISQFIHVRSCDPVISDGKFAYVTLRSGTNCGGFTNQMDVINVESIRDPALVRSYPFTNPHGLSKDGNVLFVCDGSGGLKVLDATNANEIVTKKTFSGLQAIDVVAMNKLACVVLNNGVQLYAYDAQFNVQLLGSLSKN